MPSFEHPQSPDIKKRKRDGDLSPEVQLKLSHTHPYDVHNIYDRKLLSRKRLRSSASTPLGQPHSQYQNPHANPASPPRKAPILAPCHICHRKPTVRSDLDSYADCEACQERTCFVCMRECLGPNFTSGHGVDSVDGMELSFEHKAGKGVHWRVVCSRCCCERGVDGEVWCLGCVGEGL